MESSPHTPQPNSTGIWLSFFTTTLEPSCSEDLRKEREPQIEWENRGTPAAKFWKALLLVRAAITSVYQRLRRHVLGGMGISNICSFGGHSLKMKL